jgi:phosphate:Na+ symporter
LQELSKPAFLFNDALVDPSLALELATREEARLAQRLPTMLDEIRSEGGPVTVAPEILRAASRSIGDAIGSYLRDILDSNPDRDDSDRIIRLQHRTVNLGALFDALDDFRVAAHDANQWPSSAKVAKTMIEALHAQLSALVDAISSMDPSERDFVLSLLGSREELMERMRQRVLHENPDLPAKAREALFSATMLFERIVWLARRIAMLLSSSEPTSSMRIAT